jgi:PhoPQ-activated pathogenicity-related protein
MMDIATFYHNVVLLKKPAPTYKWSIAADKSSITVVVDPNNKPTFIKVWRAHNHLKRDFRLLTGPSVEDINPIFWFETELVPQADGVTYVVETTKPQNGWEGYFVEMSYDIGGAAILGDHLIQLTTPIAVYPDVYPFPPCTTNC